MAILPHSIYTMSLFLLFYCILNHFLFSPLSLSLHSVYMFLYASLLNLFHLFLFTGFSSPSPLIPVYHFPFPTKFPSSILYHVNPSVSVSLSSTLLSLILGFICLSLAHLRSTHAWFYLHHNVLESMAVFLSLHLLTDVTHCLFFFCSGSSF